MIRLRTLNLVSSWLTAHPEDFASPPLRLLVRAFFGFIVPFSPQYSRSCSNLTARIAKTCLGRWERQQQLGLPTIMEQLLSQPTPTTAFDPTLFWISKPRVRPP